LSSRLVVIPGLPDFHVRYPEIVWEIGFVERGREGRRDCGMRIGGPGDSALIARSLPASHGESCVAACETGLGCRTTTLSAHWRRSPGQIAIPAPAGGATDDGALSPSSASNFAFVCVYRLAGGVRTGMKIKFHS